jgi:hypothetical protein
VKDLCEFGHFEITLKMLFSNVGVSLFIIYRPGARGIRRNISRSDDIFQGALPEENIITEGNIAESPERRVYK